MLESNLSKRQAGIYLLQTTDPFKVKVIFKCINCSYCKYINNCKLILLPNGKKFKPQHFVNSRMVHVIYMMICVCKTYYIDKSKCFSFRTTGTLIPPGKCGKRNMCLKYMFVCQSIDHSWWQTAAHVTKNQSYNSMGEQKSCYKIAALLLCMHIATIPSCLLSFIWIQVCWSSFQAEKVQ